MPRRYWLTTTTSDLTGGADFNYLQRYNVTPTGAAVPFTVSIAGGATETSFGFTAPVEPGFDGATGDYTIQANVTTANNNIFLAFQLDRINVSGVVQTSSTVTAEQSLGALGAKGYSFTALNLGTFAVTDRLRIRYIFRNSSGMTAQSCAIAANSLNAFVEAPYVSKVRIIT